MGRNMNNAFKMLEYDKIIDNLKLYALSEQTKKKFEDLKPYLSEAEVQRHLRETTEARKLLDAIGTPPLISGTAMSYILEAATKGGMLLPEQLEYTAQFAAAGNRLKRYLDRGKNFELRIAFFGENIDNLEYLRQEIEQAIRNGKVDDLATTEMKNIRRRIEAVNSQIKSKLESILRGKKEYFADSFISNRNGHFVLPVKREYKFKVPGSVIDQSASGATYFIEPTVVTKLQEELSLLLIEESNEERKILYTLTSLLADCSIQIQMNLDIMEELDFIFSKGKLSLEMKAIPAKINTTRYIHITKARHPMLDPERCVPLDFTIGQATDGIIITGPNTGGKTVALKTVGLLSLMSQSGLHVPCETAEICMSSQVFCDIGDGQSITENLSTFSSHIRNIIDIVTHINEESLVLLDELGSGTDPAEGMGIAIAILEELRKTKCLFLATTHYPEVKSYAAKMERLTNARMTFDRENLKPLYQLKIGEAGESCALYIARKLGMPNQLLLRAHEETYGCSSMEKTLIDTMEKKITCSSTEKIKKIEEKKPVNENTKRFQIGDSVVVYPQKSLGIVFKTANERGDVGVQIKKSKHFINHKRLQLKVAANELYPADYDFSIIFDSVENRKARHKMDKGHQEDLVITYSTE